MKIIVFGTFLFYYKQFKTFKLNSEANFSKYYIRNRELENADPGKRSQ